jgi:hypothetical protein
MLGDEPRERLGLLDVRQVGGSGEDDELCVRDLARNQLGMVERSRRILGARED